MRIESHNIPGRININKDKPAFELSLNAMLSRKQLNELSDCTLTIVNPDETGVNVCLKVNGVSWVETTISKKAISFQVPFKLVCSKDVAAIFTMYIGFDDTNIPENEVAIQTILSGTSFSSVDLRRVATLR